MAAPVYNPKVQVFLHKTIGRQTVDGGVPVSSRFKGAARFIDLTPFLGDGGSVTVQKSVRAPAGAFSLTLSDKVMGADQMESIYGLVEPMDVIEIRMGRGLAGIAAGQLPMMMRGFVSSVRRAETMAGGQPSRSVVIDGQDYGKILQLIQINYFQGYVLGSNVMTSLQLFANYGIDYGIQNERPYAELLADIIDKVVNDAYLKELSSANGFDDLGQPINRIERLKVEAHSPGGACGAFGVQKFDGTSVFDFLRKFGDIGSFYELFVEDRDDGVYVIYRPNPFKSAGSGALIRPPQDKRHLPVTVDISDADIVSLSVGRSDANVANFYWVDPPPAYLVNGMALRQFAATGDPNEFVNFGSLNSTPHLYGIRKMEVATAQYPRLDGQSEEVLNSKQGDLLSLLFSRREWLRDQNQDNVVFESGSMRIKGNEEVRPGRYVRVTRGRFSWEAYVVAASHDYVPYVGYFTSVQFERGTGFIERVKREQGEASAYLSEWNAGGAM